MWASPPIADVQFLHQRRQPTTSEILRGQRKSRLSHKTSIRIYDINKQNPIVYPPKIYTSRLSTISTNLADLVYYAIYVSFFFDVSLSRIKKAPGVFSHCRSHCKDLQQSTYYYYDDDYHVLSC